MQMPCKSRAKSRSTVHVIVTSHPTFTMHDSGHDAVLEETKSNDDETTAADAGVGQLIIAAAESLFESTKFDERKTASDPSEKISAAPVSTPIEPAAMNPAAAADSSAPSMVTIHLGIDPID
jgi:hypothetical protein